MAFNYAGLRATASRLIASAGQDATLRRITRAAYDPNNAGAAVVTTTDAPCKVVTDTYSLRLIDGTLIQLGDLHVFASVDGVSFTPAPGDQLILGGVKYNVVTCDPLQPGGTVLLFEMQARRA